MSLTVWDRLGDRRHEGQTVRDNVFSALLIAYGNYKRRDPRCYSAMIFRDLFMSLIYFIASITLECVNVKHLNPGP